MNINKNYLSLKESYLFLTISERVKDFQQKNPDREIIRLGIGDVTLPLVPAVITAMQNAVSEMADRSTFRGYLEEPGYDFLRNSICGYYAKKGVSISQSEVFIGDGAKSDLGNILDIFSADNSALIPDPVYPVYVDTNIMAGRDIMYMNGTRENNFLPMPEESVRADIIYLCSPNNPTGAIYNKEQLKEWVNYALANNSVILFDSAYEIFVRGKNLPTSIYQIDGAEKCAIEFCSLSKTAGFTGTRCGYTVVPHAIVRDGVSLNRLWFRRQTTKFNQVSYIVQRGAEAAFSDAGYAQIRENSDYYMSNAKLISDTLKSLGIWHTGGENSPYIWLECPGNMTSWEFFDKLLSEASVVGTPGAGFGVNGEGFFRLSAFGERENIQKALERMKKI